MKSEILTVQGMTEGLTATGMPEDQASTVVQAIAEGIQSFAVTPAKLQQELAPIKRSLSDLETRVSVLESRVDELSASVSDLTKNVRDLANKMDAGFESINSRIFWLTMAVLGTMGAMLAAMLSVLITSAL